MEHGRQWDSQFTAGVDTDVGGPLYHLISDIRGKNEFRSGVSPGRN
jgi:hypothetical protein